MKMPQLDTHKQEQSPMTPAATLPFMSGDKTIVNFVIFAAMDRQVKNTDDFFNKIQRLPEQAHEFVRHCPSDASFYYHA